ncbi:MAG: DnaB-like helicase C-terminal domain-containing protein, partial [Candidatus Thorarchaeota archaeon]
EMSQQQLTVRLLSMESGVPYEDIIKEENNLKDEEKDSLREANERIQSFPIIIDDNSEQTVAQIKLKARQHINEG